MTGTDELGGARVGDLRAAT
ncbi:hypothetical protein CCACVL1_12752 [Corchorus capsularis]|uniref:Uncharacterized protein n=1 Tax=Corchorus capsularis TaxID=210143 RepID=A0A1R3IDX5_COCAP|nr:hypothetical protein CCACVL1_12752 [Corchorus capsularis]